jgi:hypothetical protein
MKPHLPGEDATQVLHCDIRKLALGEAQLALDGPGVPLLHI